MLALLLAGGCATPSLDRDSTQRALRAIPEVPLAHVRADRALLSAFLAAHGIRPTRARLAEIIPDAAPQGHLDRHALRNMAREHHYQLLVIKADERYLWEELKNNRPLLVRLPPDTAYTPAAPLFIPTAWDRARRTIQLLDGNGEVQSIPDAEFFARREPLKQAALCLVRSERSGPAREQRLLLSDFWYGPGGYPRPRMVRPEDPPPPPPGADAQALVEHGNRLLLRRRYPSAVTMFRAALALEPDHPRILNLLAYAMLHGDRELLTALRHAKKAMQIEPANPVYIETVGSITLRLGDALRAARHFELAWAYARRRPPEIQIAIMDQLVRAWLASDREDLAREVAEHRHRTYPDFQIPRDILVTFPFLRLPPASPDEDP